MNSTLSIFWQFLKRDFFIYRNRYINLFINYSLIYPVIFSFAIGYVQSYAYFGNNPTLSTINFIGHILIISLVLANTINVGLLFDLEHQRFIDYQIILLNPRLVLLERMLFTSLLTFSLSIAFFPVSILVMGASFDSSKIMWPSVYLILYLGSLCCSAYTLFAACVIKSSHFLRSYWMRVNFGLLTLGGLFIPQYIFKQLSPMLGYVTYLNPLLYITEGLRQAILQDSRFLPLWVCTVALLGFTLLFINLAWYFFKKRVDHI